MSKDFTSLKNAPVPKDEIVKYGTDQDAEYQFGGVVGNAKEPMEEINSRKSSASLNSNTNPIKLYDDILNQKKEESNKKHFRRRSSVFQYEDFKKEMYDRSNMFH